MLIAPCTRGLGRLHRVVLVVDRRGRAGEVVDLVDLDVEREGHVVPHQLEMRIAQAGGDIVLAAGEVVVDAQHVVARRQQPLAKMRAEKTGAAGHQNPLAHVPPSDSPLEFPHAASDTTRQRHQGKLTGWPSRSRALQISCADTAPEQPDVPALVYEGRKTSYAGARPRREPGRQRADRRRHRAAGPRRPSRQVERPLLRAAVRRRQGQRGDRVGQLAARAARGRSTSSTTPRPRSCSSARNSFR